MFERAIALESARQEYAHTPEAADAFIDSLIEYFEWMLGGGGNLRVAETHAKQALTHDPDFAPAHRMLSIWYAMRLGYELTADEALPLAHSHVRQWLKAEPDDTYPLALINRLLDLDPRSALANIDHAERHPSPNVTPALLAEQRCRIRQLTGELVMAEAACLEAVALSPNSETFRVLSDINRKLGRTEMALDYLRDAVRGELASSTATLVSTILAARINNDYAQAELALDQLLATRGAQPEQYMHFVALVGRTEYATELAGNAEAAYAEGKLTAYHPLFFTYHQLGNREKALFWLSKAIENREDVVVAEIRTSPEWYADLCDDPRAQPIFARLREIEEMGSPTTSAATRTDSPASPESLPLCGES